MSSKKLPLFISLPFPRPIKWGLGFVGIYVLILLGLIIASATIPFFVFFAIKIAVLPAFFVVNWIDISSILPLIILNLISVFVYGFILGLIYGKFKNRNKNPQM